MDEKLTLFQGEIDIDLNELFTIDFKNLKIFLSTLLKNQNEMAKKIKNLENKFKEQEFMKYSQKEKQNENPEYNIDNKDYNINKDKYLTDKADLDVIRSKEKSVCSKIFNLWNKRRIDRGFPHFDTTIQECHAPESVSRDEIIKATNFHD